ncbi:MAG: 5-bromo-4-chloroindolyl phosphate hydrolysis family protein [Clostridiales bacterium]|nr:5-bromo-4-chloroindolyl phosphate hydrolysis family protein [Clostridiales bacterium]
MSENNWDNIGRQIKDTVDDAIYYGDFTNLSRSIGDIINDTIDTVRGSAGGRHQGQSAQQRSVYQTDQNAGRRTSPVTSLYETRPRGRVSSILMCVFGSILTVVFGICFIVFLIVVLSGGIPALAGMIFFAVLTVLALVPAVRGRVRLGLLSRYRRYLRVVQHSLNIPIRELAESTGKSLEYTTRDLLKMIEMHWFLQAHVDEEQHYLILSDEAYQSYLSAKSDYTARERQAAEVQRQADEAKRKDDGLSPECRRLIGKGEEYIRHIHESNERIPGAEFSAKLDQMEHVVARIFDVVRAHPEVASDLDKLMSYYLPTTKKLLDTYQEMDRQPVAGENISSAKHEIEEAVDTLNVAFEKLLDSLFEDKAWDISSDISVLHTVLAQDGLKEDAFKK